MPPKGLEFSGGDCYGEELNVPGKMCFPNITPDAEFGIGKWSDGEIMRAVREGVNPKGDALMPGMPYPNYKDMADEDVRAIVAYLRTVPPVNKAARTRASSASSSATSSTPSRAAQGPRGPGGPQHPRGLWRVPGEDGRLQGLPHSSLWPRLDEDEAFAGGEPFKIPGVINAVTANITPDVETGIGALTKRIGRFKAFEDPESITAIDENHQTMMAWSRLRRDDGGGRSRGGATTICAR